MDLKLIISDAFYFFRSNLIQISTLCLPWLFAVALVNHFIITDSDPTDGIDPFIFLAWAFDLLIYPVYTAALILLMNKRAQVEHPSNKELMTSAIKIWQPFFVVHVIGAGLTAMGLLLLIIPGIYVAVRLSFAEFYLVLDDDIPMEAIKKSFLATQPFFFQILLLIILFLAPLRLITQFIAGLVKSNDVGPLVHVTASTLIGFLTLFIDVLIFRVFMSVKRLGTAQPPD